MLLTPFYMQWVVDGVLVSADRDLLVTLGIGFGLLVLIQVGAGALRSWAVLHLSATLNLQWLGNVFAHLMRLPVSWFEKRHTGDVMSRFGAVQHDPADADHELRRGRARRPAGGRDAGDDARLQRHADGDRRGRRRRLRAAALGLLPPAARGDRGGDRPRRQALDPLPRVAARRAVDQAVQPPGRPAGALHEPGGRRDERRHRDAQARPDVRASCTSSCSASSGSRWSGSARCWCSTALLGRHAVRVPRLQGAVRAARQRASSTRWSSCKMLRAAGRAPGRHRAGRRPSRWSTRRRASGRTTPTPRACATSRFALLRRRAPVLRRLQPARSSRASRWRSSARRAAARRPC